MSDERFDPTDHELEEAVASMLAAPDAEPRPSAIDRIRAEAEARRDAAASANSAPVPSPAPNRPDTVEPDTIEPGPAVVARGERAGALTSRWWLAAAAAVVVAFALGTVLGWAVGDDGELADSFGPDAVVEFDGTMSGVAGDDARLLVVKTGIGREITLTTDELEILPTGEYYEVWFVAPDDTPDAPNRISAGTFHPDADGRSNVRFAAAVDPALFPTIQITAEPEDGDPRSSGRVLLEATITP